MNKTTKIVVVAVLVIVVVAVIAGKRSNRTVAVEEGTGETSSLPRLADFGSDKCIPCKMMAPILDELRKEYADSFRVEFYDVWKDASIGKSYGIKVIPTQIFYDAGGKELFRHVGFFSKQDILAKWKQLGINVETKQE